MKKPIVTGLLASCLLMTSCRPQGSTMTKEELIAMMKTVATRDLKLIPVECVSPAFQDQPDTFCYASTEEAEEWAERVNGLPGFRSVTGWRDDYGVMSAALQYQKVKREIGVNYVRPTTFWDLPKYDELRSHKAEGYVVITVTDDDPATREQW